MKLVIALYIIRTEQEEAERNEAILDKIIKLRLLANEIPGTQECVQSRIVDALNELEALL